MRFVVTAALAVLATGCDLVYGLSGRSDIAIDALAIDAPADLAIDQLSGHDEDGDTFDDAIDVCPGMHDLNQADSDGDGVGDVCDPHPILAIDRLAYFSSLRDFTGWNMRAGNWVQLVDAVRLDPGNGHLLAVYTQQAFSYPTVFSEIEAVAPLVATGYAMGVYLVTDTSVPGGFPPGVACYEIVGMPSVLGIYDQRVTPAQFNSINFAPTTLPLQISAQSSRGTTAPTGPATCNGWRATGNPVTVLSPTNPAEVTSAHAGLRAYSTGVTFKSVTVIERRP